MSRIKARVQVHLPHDSNGVSATPGQVIEVETDHPQILGYLQVGYLVALDPLAFPGDLKPPMAPLVDDVDADAAVAAQDEAEAGASAAPDGSATDPSGDGEAQETPSTRSSRAKK